MTDTFMHQTSFGRQGMCGLLAVRLSQYGGIARRLSPRHARLSLGGGGPP
jgi:hypothetical protein